MRHVIIITEWGKQASDIKMITDEAMLQNTIWKKPKKQNTRAQVKKLPSNRKKNCFLSRVKWNKDIFIDSKSVLGKNPLQLNPMLLINGGFTGVVRREVKGKGNWACQRIAA